MLKFLEEQRTLSFVGAVLLALAGWGQDFATWSDMFNVQHIFGLLMILGGLFAAWATKRPDFLKADPEVKP